MTGMMEDEPVTDFTLTVVVRLYGAGTAEDVAHALESYTGSFDLPGDREAEVISAKPATGHTGSTGSTGPDLGEDPDQDVWDYLDDSSQCGHCGYDPCQCAPWYKSHTGH
jgi:hypothetical protein